MHLAALVVLAILYISFAREYRKLLDMTNTIVVAWVVGSFFQLPGVVLYFVVSVFV